MQRASFVHAEHENLSRELRTVSSSEACVSEIYDCAKKRNNKENKIKNPKLCKMLLEKTFL
jgi:hypothetical protein